MWQNLSALFKNLKALCINRLIAENVVEQNCIFILREDFSEFTSCLGSNYDHTFLSIILHMRYLIS